MIVRDANGVLYKLGFVYGIVRPDGRRFVSANLIPWAEGTALRKDDRTKFCINGKIVGVAICSETDEFRRSAGRMLALTRALAALADITSANNALAVLQAYESRPRAPKKDPEVKRRERVERRTQRRQLKAQARVPSSCTSR